MAIWRPLGDVQGNVPMPVADHKAIVVAEVVVYLGKDIVSGGARRSGARKVGRERGTRGCRIELVNRLCYGADPGSRDHVPRKGQARGWIVNGSAHVREIPGAFLRGRKCHRRRVAAGFLPESVVVEEEKGFVLAVVNLGDI